MSTTTASHRTHRDDEIAGRSLAEWFALIAGSVLVLVGLLGFLADATFDADPGVQGDSFLGFEVNGWHNLVHIATGALLLSGAGSRRRAKTVTLIFGLAYLVVTLIGLIDGSDVLGLIPVNGADNVLHLVLALASLAASFATKVGDHAGHGNIQTGAPRGGVVGRRTVDTGAGRFSADSRDLTPERHRQTTRGE